MIDFEGQPKIDIGFRAIEGRWLIEQSLGIGVRARFRAGGDFTTGH